MAYADAGAGADTILLGGTLSLALSRAVSSPSKRKEYIPNTYIRHFVRKNIGIHSKFCWQSVYVPKYAFS